MEFLHAEVGENGQIRVNRGSRDGGSPSNPPRKSSELSISSSATLGFSSAPSTRTGSG